MDKLEQWLIHLTVQCEVHTFTHIVSTAKLHAF